MSMSKSDNPNDYDNSILSDVPVPTEVASASVLDSESIEEKEQMHYPKVSVKTVGGLSG